MFSSLHGGGGGVEVRKVQGLRSRPLEAVLCVCVSCSGLADSPLQHTLEVLDVSENNIR